MTPLLVSGPKDILSARPATTSDDIRGLEESSRSIVRNADLKWMEKINAGKIQLYKLCAF